MVLLATLGRQVVKQAREGTGEGVSRWLFAGQTTASVGFTAYSILLGNWVFTVTNALILASAIAGLVISRRQRRRRDTSPAWPRGARTA
jgi:hypothetical protein